MSLALGRPLARLQTMAPLVAGVLVFTATLLASNVAVLRVTRHAMNRARAGLPPAVAARLERCHEAPASWRPERVGRWRYDAYDEAGRPAGGGDAPPVDPALRAQLERGDPSPGRLGWWWGYDSRLLRRARPDGPCALLQLTLDDARPGGGRSLLLGTGVAVVLSWLGGLGAHAALVVPLRRRLRRLRESVEGMGEEHRYRALDDQIPDDLGTVARAMNEVHRRLLRDADLLRRRASELQTHMADVAHDVRTPLASLQLILERTVRRAPDGELRAEVSLALTEAIYLGSLLENLQLQSRLATDGPPRETPLDVDLARVVDALGLRFALLGAQRDVEVAAARPDEPLIVGGDPAMIERALANLVHNAVAHNHRGGHVALSLERDPTGFLLVVEDDGPGLPPEARARLLAAAPTPPAREARRGLGLAIARAVLDRLGWSCRLGPAPAGGGSRIEIRGPGV